MTSQKFMGKTLYRFIIKCSKTEKRIQIKTEPFYKIIYLENIKKTKKNSMTQLCSA